MHEHHQASQPQQPPPPQPPNWQTPLGPQQPPKKRRVGLIIGAVIGGLIVLCCGGAGIVAMVSGADSTDVAADADADAGGGEKSAKVAKVGEPARDGKFEFTVTKVDDSGRKRVGDQYFGTTAQGEFILVHVTVKNIADQPQTFSGEEQKLFSADGKEFSADTEAAIYMGEASQSLWEEINPGNVVKGVVVFDVPKGTKLSKLVLHDSAFSGGVEVSL
ncbi:MAG: DUF4352 domain-containing protein [Micromonosporaceae bacterium]